MGPLRQSPVLLAEDDPDFTTLLEDAMAMAGWTIPLRVLPDGEQVLDFFSRELNTLPRLLLLDLQLPKVSGLNVLRELRQNPRTRSLPVVILTASSSASAVFEAYDCGANSYILKPGTLEGLIEKMQALKQYLDICESPP